MTPLTEGVTPTGKEMNVTKIEATVKQYGDFIELSDLLILTAIDNNIVEATTLIGSQAGRTLDTISREVLAAGTNVQYAEGQVTSRAALTPEMKLTVKAVKKAVRFLKKQNAKKINGYYYGIVHPDCSYAVSYTHLVEDIDTTQEDHIYDECRYFLMQYQIAKRANVKKKPPLDDPLDLYKACLLYTSRCV